MDGEGWGDGPDSETKLQTRVRGWTDEYSDSEEEDERRVRNKNIIMWGRQQRCR
jgi:hypothetical protein